MGDSKMDLYGGHGHGWRMFAKAEELQRVNALNERISRKIENNNHDQAEIKKIRRRAIARMRRKEGKT